jgi:monothiol glutaredoxin
MDIIETIKDQITSNNVIIYMKGTPQFPQCGFSARAVEALMAVGKPFAYVNILEHPDIRAELPKFANWPTFPQLWVKGELVGGSDIILEMQQSGELGTLISEAVEKEASGQCCGGCGGGH